jgi:hypothetical protein
MSVASNSGLRAKAVYLLLRRCSSSAQNLIIWHELPTFRQLLVRPGEVVPEPYDPWLMTTAIVAAQCAYWYRLQKVGIPFKNPNVIASHVFLLWGRLNFLYGGGLFSVVIFRHLPQIDLAADFWLAATRAPIFVLSLFTMFCFSLELERLAAVLSPPHS